MGGGVLRDPPQAGRRERRKFEAERRISAGAIHSPRGLKEKGPPQDTVLWENDPASPKFIVTKRGMGYLFGG